MLPVLGAAELPLQVEQRGFHWIILKLLVDPVFENEVYCAVFQMVAYCL